MIECIENQVTRGINGFSGGFFLLQEGLQILHVRFIEFLL
jgi:hypothetical protein